MSNHPERLFRINLIPSRKVAATNFNTGTNFIRAGKMDVAKSILRGTKISLVRTFNVLANLSTSSISFFTLFPKLSDIVVKLIDC